MPSILLQPDVLTRAEALGLAAQQVVEGLRVGEHKSPYRGFSVEFVQHREYVPGDDIRHIDWKSYGRTERYTIKQYEQETNFIGHFLLDGSNSMRYGDGAENKLAYAKLLTASLAYLIVRQRDSFALRIFDSHYRTILPASSQMGHVQTLCRELEALEPAEKSGMGRLLEEFADQISRRGLVFLISDCFDDPEVSGISAFAATKSSSSTLFTAMKSSYPLMATSASSIWKARRNSWPARNCSNLPTSGLSPTGSKNSNAAVTEAGSSISGCKPTAHSRRHSERISSADYNGANNGSKLESNGILGQKCHTVAMADFRVQPWLSSHPSC